jgi:hypothetical protein
MKVFKLILARRKIVYLRIWRSLSPRKLIGLQIANPQIAKIYGPQTANPQITSFAEGPQI